MNLNRDMHGRPYFFIPLRYHRGSSSLLLFMDFPDLFFQDLFLEMMHFRPMSIRKYSEFLFCTVLC